MSIAINSARRRRAYRLFFVLVIIEAVAYFFEMIIVASRLHGGTATGTAHVVQRVFGAAAFTAVRHGYHSQVSSAAWVVPSLVVIPVAVALIAYFWPPQKNNTQRHAYGSAIDLYITVAVFRPLVALPLSYGNCSSL